MAARLAFAALTFFCVGAPVAAAPYTPASDDVVLERLPEKLDPSLAELKRLRTALVRRPDDTTLAVRLARRAIEASRETGDPRFLGQAQAALAPWWNVPDAPVDIVVLRATIRQSLHDFPAALRDLDRVLATAPTHGQARLTRATILTVLGRYDEATRDCDALARLAVELVTLACRAAPASLDGRAAQAYASLDGALQHVSAATPELAAWGHTLAAEIAARRGDASAAEAHFRQALAADPRDAYLRGAFADFLLDRGRPRDAAALVASDVRNDSLLLRLALAEARFTDATPAERRAATEHREDLAARFAASRARGDVVHRREEARYALVLEGDAPRALALARANWEVQRESADLRILAEAARATSDAGAIEVVRRWRREHRMDDVAIVAALGERS